MKTPTEYESLARELFLSGYNCAQSVAVAFCDVLGLEPSQTARLVSSFGGGMGRLRQVCGCFSGILLVLGQLYGYDDPKEFDGKKELYARVQELAATFQAQNGSIICKELLGLAGQDNSPTPEQRTQEYYSKRPCPDLAASAARILAEYMEQHPWS